MEKKMYVSPELEIILFEGNVDVLTATSLGENELEIDVY